MDFPLPLSEAAALVTNITSHTRPVSPGEMLQALNFGQNQVVKAILAVRPQFLASFVDGFQIQAGVQEYDLTGITPAVARPTQLIIPGSTVPIVIFRYKAMQDPESESKDGQRGSTVGVFLYDILEGRFPRTPLQYVALTGGGALQMASAADAAQFPVGSTLLLPQAGAQVPVSSGGFSGVQDLYATVVSSAGVFVTPSIVPSMDSAGYGTVPIHAVVPLWRRMLRLVPSPGTPYTGRLYYQSRPPRFRTLDDVLDPIVGQHIDLVVEYALWQLLRAVNEADAADHWNAAHELRAEMIQELEPLAWSNGEAFSSGLADD